MKNKLGDKERLGHILDSIYFITKAVEGKNETEFQNDFILHTATTKWLENIGEASYKITPAFKSLHTIIAWRQIEGLRHILVHEYFGIDLVRIWMILKNDLFKLNQDVQTLYNELE